MVAAFSQNKTVKASKPYSKKINKQQAVRIAEAKAILR
jgi:hypothetical protein